MINDFDRRGILSGSQLGFEFEFYSNLSRDKIARDLGRFLRKRIEVSDKYHSETEVDQDHFKLEPDFSGGMKMHELVTGVMPYEEARTVLIQILKWIKENGWTDERSALHLNLSFDKMKLKLKHPIEQINRLKFVLGFDEKFIYDRFPRRQNSIYARSINQITPINRFIFVDKVTIPDPTHYVLPGSKYYGINFEKLPEGYFEIRYLGGRDYEQKSRQVTEIMDYIIMFTYDTLQANYSYTPDDVGKLNAILREQKKMVRTFSDVQSFFLNYPNIKLMVDLRANTQVIKTFYPQIREKLFDLILLSGMRRGKLNYDADVGKFQLKDGILRKAFPVEGMELMNTKVTGNIVNCDLYGCDIRNSHIENSNIFRHNVLKGTKIIETPFHYNNHAIDCYLDNKLFLINGKVDGGIIRSGEVGRLAGISDETEIIEGAVKYAGEGKYGMNKDDKDKLSNPGIKGIDTLD